MKSTLIAPALAVALCLFALGAAGADTAAKKEPTAQQQKMKDCNKQALGKKGDERKQFMSTCLKGESATPMSSQQEKMKTCNAQAKEQKLAGDARKSFMSSCLKG
jgi:hypothetical protein